MHASTRTSAGASSNGPARPLVPSSDTRCRLALADRVEVRALHNAWVATLAFALFERAGAPAARR
jgi:hypothetical protein